MSDRLTKTDDGKRKAELHCGTIIFDPDENYDIVDLHNEVKPFIKEEILE